MKAVKWWQDDELGEQARDAGKVRAVCCRKCGERYELVRGQIPDRECRECFDGPTILWCIRKPAQGERSYTVCLWEMDNPSRFTIQLFDTEAEANTAIVALMPALTYFARCQWREARDDERRGLG